MKGLGNMKVSYSATDDAVYGKGSLTMTDGTTLDYGWYEREQYPYYVYTYPDYTCVKKDAFEKAFKIAKMLLAKKLLKSAKLKDFIGLVEMIAKEL